MSLHKIRINRTLLVSGGIILVIMSAWYFKTSNLPTVCFFDDSNSTRKCFTVEKMTTPQQQTTGLSNRKSMPINDGMLFVFDRSDKHCFWMKDMKFSIDMIWLDDQKKVVDIKVNVSPDTYPETFCPQVDALYVFEVNAGVSAQNGVKIGQTVAF